MQVIQLEDRVIYRPSKGKKVKFINETTLYSEIVVSKPTDKIVEVDK